MTQLLERMREELVRRNYAESSIRAYMRIVEDFEVTPTSVWTESAPMICGAITPTSWRSASWQCAQLCSTWPQFASSTARH